jgi:hypothetical protein
MATAQQVAETKQMVREAMQEEGVSAETLVRLGQMAEAVLKNKSLYPQFVQAVIDSDLAEDGDIPATIDYQMLGVFATLGEMARQMIASGELGA